METNLCSYNKRHQPATTHYSQTVPETLTEQTHLLQLILDNMGDGVVAVDVEGHLIACNPAAQQICGFHCQTLAEASACHFGIFLSDGITPCPLEQQPLRRAMRGDVADRVEVLIRNPQRPEGVYTETTIRPLKDDTGTLRGGICVFRDITQRKHAEQALYRHQQEFAALVENAPEIIARLDQELRYLYINPAVETVLGIPRHRFIGKTSQEVGFADDVTEALEQSGRQVIASGQEGVVEVSIPTCNGELFFRIRLVPEFNPDKIVESILTITADITALKQTEAALREREELFRKIFEDAPIAISLAKTTDYRMVQVNAVHRELLGYSEADLATLTFVDLTHPEDVALDLEQMKQLVAGQIPRFQIEKRFIKKNGDAISTHFTVTLIRDREGRPLYSMGMAEDISDRKQAEVALYESRERFRSIFEQVAVGLAYTSLNGQYLMVNQKLCEILGYARADLLTKTYLDVTYPEDLLLDRRETERLLAGEIPTVSMEKRYIRQDGSLVWTNLTVSLLRGLAGEPSCLVAVVEDISTRKHAETELQETRKFLESVLDNLPVAVIAKDAKDLHFAFWNQAAGEILGYQPEEVLGKTDYDLFPQEQADFFVSKDRETLQSRQTVVIPEEQIRVKQGAERLLRTVKSTVLDQEGRPLYLLAITEDITEQKLAEFALKDSEYRFRRLFESNVVGVIFANSQGEISEANDLFLQMSGYTRSELQAGVVGWQMMMPQACHSWAQWVTTQEKGSPWEKELLCKDGSRLPVLIGGALLEGSHDTGVAFIVDISKRKQAEEKLKTSLQEKEILLKEIHHRVKNNLYVVSSLLELQSDTIVDPQVAKIFEESQNRLYSMALIHEKLYRSHNLVQIDFGEYLEDLVIHLFESYNISNRIRLCLKIENILLNIETAMPCGLLVNELISNSIKHAFPEERPGTITVELSGGAEQKIHLTVQDNGVGIAESLDVQQANSMGFQVVYTLVKQLKATLNVERQSGTAFHLSFLQLNYRRRVLLHE